MRFTINKNEFLKSLSVVSKPIPSKSFIASLVFVKLSLDDRGLTLVGSNESIAISTIINFTEGDKEIIRNYKAGAILVQGHYLLEIVRKLSGDELTFELIDNSVVQITDNRSSFKLNSAPAEEYPEYDFNESGTEFTVNTKDFIALIEQTSFAAAQKENRPMLTAINLNGKDNKLTAVALDSARLSKKEISIEENGEFTANLPSRTANEIIRMFEDVDKINVVVNERKMFFKFGSTVIASNLLNGEYPNTNGLGPKSQNYILEANAQEFLNTIDRVALLSNEKATVKLTVSSDEFEISSTTNEVGSAVEKITNYQFQGNRFEVLVNSSFVIDAVKALRSDDITLIFESELKAFIIKSEKDSSVIQLITPVRG